MLTDYATHPDTPRQESRAMYTSEAKWPSELAPPVDPADTLLCMRAQSALSGADLGQVHDLTTDQSRDVLAWYDPKY